MEYAIHLLSGGVILGNMELCCYFCSSKWNSEDSQLLLVWLDACLGVSVLSCIEHMPSQELPTLPIPSVFEVYGESMVYVKILGVHINKLK